MKKISINKKLIIAVSLGILFATGCKKFRDVNTDPNNAADVTVELLLPTAEADLAQVYGGKLQILGSMWAQYWTQNPNSAQYREIEQYSIDGSVMSNAWNELYVVGLKDMDQIIKKAGTKKNYAAIAKILKGYSFHLLTDQWDAIPFTEALKADEGISSPRYDSQEAVYMGVIAMVKEGRDQLDDASAAPGDDDLIYHGDLEAWRKFANTLLLKVYMRLSQRNASLAQQGVAEVYTHESGFLAAGESAEVHYSTEAGNYNPTYSEMNNATITQIQNLIASKTAVDSMMANNDPRLPAFYNPVGGNFIALEQGFYGIPNPAASYSTPSAAVGAHAANIASAAAPVRLLSDYESLFLQAEAAARGWAPGDDAALFEEAVRANMSTYGVAEDDVTDYLANAHWAQYPAAGELLEKLRYIITQKWFCMCGNQGIEAWSEWRRTGFPSFFTISRATRIGQQFPVRIPYPDDEVTNNLNFPGQKQVTDKVWWDAN